jgi:hypothetical protein
MVPSKILNLMAFVPAEDFELEAFLSRPGLS